MSSCRRCTDSTCSSATTISMVQLTQNAWCSGTPCAGRKLNDLGPVRMA
jgi:hypothetical protein